MPNNDFLNSLLKEYEQKKLKAEIDAENRKTNLYNNVPRLQEIEDTLNSLAIETAKNILNKSNENSLEILNNKIELLKKEKIDLLN